MSDILNFSLLGAGYLCNSVNIFELCSSSQLNYLEAVYILGIAFKICYVEPEHCLV